MEKKGARLMQVASKGALSDSKKSQDVSNGKLWPRNGRRREPNGGSVSTTTKNETIRNKSTNKTFDKRPRARGNYNNNASTSNVDRTETARLEEQIDAELGSVFVRGSKKQSLNHLLNFVYAPVGNGGNGNYPRQDKSTKKGNNWMMTRKHKYNKEHYLQANCQFIVNVSGNYKQYLNNPDALVDWNLIEQVNVQVSDYASCPICLYPPMAAKMTRCGHIYCWSCILHYLSLSDKTWRKCPICYESINQTDLKSVISIPHKTFNSNDFITFKLMKRPKGCLTAYPATANILNEDQIFNVSQSEASEVYSKLLLANNEEIMSIIEREYKELQQQLNENSPENCFVEQALTLLAERKSKIGFIEGRILEETLECLDINDNNNIIEEKSQDGNNIDPECLDLPENANQQSIKYYYFYQASDGQHIYLHAINARMLEDTYGSLEFAPKTLSGRILEKEGGSMTEDLRKRLRCLQHLPVTCQFEVAEIELKAPVVSKDTLQMFNDQLEIRRKRRQRRAKEEKKREKHIADEENRLMGKYPVPNLHIDSEIQFPNFETARCLDSDSQLISSCENSNENTPSSSISKDNDYQGLSFAKMLASTSKKKPSDWPKLNATTSGPPIKLITVTGVDTKSTLLRAHNVSDDDNDDIEKLEGVAPPPCDRKLGDEIFKALLKAEENEVSLETDSSIVGKKKKKKNRQKVLFTTSMAYTEKK